MSKALSPFCLLIDLRHIKFNHTIQNGMEFSAKIVLALELDT